MRTVFHSSQHSHVNITCFTSNNQPNSSASIYSDAHSVELPQGSSHDKKVLICSSPYNPSMLTQIHSAYISLCLIFSTTLSSYLTKVVLFQLHHQHFSSISSLSPYYPCLSKRPKHLWVLCSLTSSTA